jgi:hypothetical protein
LELKKERIKMILSKRTTIFLVLSVTLILGVVFIFPVAAEKNYPPGVCGEPAEVDPWGPNNDWGFSYADSYLIYPFLGIYYRFTTGLITNTAFNYEIRLTGPTMLSSALLPRPTYVKENNLVIERVLAYKPVLYIESRDWYEHAVTFTATESNKFKMEFSLGIADPYGICSIEGGYSTTITKTSINSWTESISGNHWKVVYVKMVFLRVHGTVKYFNDEVRTYDAMILESADWSNIYVTSDMWGDNKELPLINIDYYDSPNDGDTNPDKFYYLGQESWTYSEVRETSVYFGISIKVATKYFTLSGSAKFTWTTTSGLSIKHEFTGPGQLPSTVDYYYLIMYGFFTLNILPVKEGGGGCPILYVYDGSQYREEGLLDIHTDGPDIITSHTLITDPEAIDNYYLVRLVEHPLTISCIDRVQLFGIRRHSGRLVQLPLVSAIHTTWGDVLAKLLFSDDDRIHILGAEHTGDVSQSIDLKFYVRNDLIFEGFIFIIEGNNMHVK